MAAVNTRVTKGLAVLAFCFGFLALCGMHHPAEAKADYFGYPCSPGGQGIGADVNLALVDINGQFCDGPTQWNLSHLHCEAGGAKANIGAFGLANLGGPLSVGGVGGQGAGAGLQGCHYLCPDGALSPQPNPPFYGSSAPYVDARKVILANRAFCVKEHHLVSIGPTNNIVLPGEGDPDAYVPGPDLQALIDKNQAQAAPPPPANEPDSIPRGPAPTPTPDGEPAPADAGH